MLFSLLLCVDVISSFSLKEGLGLGWELLAEDAQVGMWREPCGLGGGSCLHVARVGLIFPGSPCACVGHLKTAGPGTFLPASLRTTKKKHPQATAVSIILPIAASLRPFYRWANRGDVVFRVLHPLGRLSQVRSCLAPCRGKVPALLPALGLVKAFFFFRLSPSHLHKQRGGEQAGSLLL